MQCRITLKLCIRIFNNNEILKIRNLKQKSNLDLSHFSQLCLTLFHTKKKTLWCFSIEFSPSILIRFRSHLFHKKMESKTTKEKVYIAGSASSENYGNNVTVSKHPILSHKISLLRSSSTSPHTFRTVLREITYQLGYEATVSLNTRAVQLTVPAGHDHITCTGKKLAERVAMIPIMRSGLGMIDSMLEVRRSIMCALRMYFIVS